MLNHMTSQYTKINKIIIQYNMQEVNQIHDILSSNQQFQNFLYFENEKGQTFYL